MNSRELSKIRLLKTKRKEKTTNPRLRNPSAKKTEKKNARLRDAKVTRTRDFEIHQKLFRGFETGPKLRPTFFRRVLNASWRGRVANAEQYGDLPPLSDRIGFRRLGLTGHCGDHCELPASQLVLWRATHGHLGRGWPVSLLIGTLMRDAGATSTSELSACMDNRADWAAISIPLLVDFDLFCVSAFQDSLLVILIMIESSKSALVVEKRS